MWEPAISGMGNTHNCAPKLQAYPPIFSRTPKASGSTWLQLCEVHTETIGVEDEWQVPNLTESVSVAEDGAVHITLTNLSLDKDYEIRTILTDYQVNEVKGEIVHGEMHEMNTFETPNQVRVKEFNEVEKTAEGIKFTIPKCSVLHLEVR